MTELPTRHPRLWAGRVHFRELIRRLPRAKTVYFCASAALTISALLLPLEGAAATDIAKWDHQARWIAAFSFVVSVFCVGSPSSAMVLTLIALRHYVVLRFGYPLLDTIGFGYLLWAVLLLDPVFYLHSRSALPAVVLLLGSTVFIEGSQLEAQLGIEAALASGAQFFLISLCGATAAYAARAAADRLAVANDALAQSNESVRKMGAVNVNFQNQLFSADERLRVELRDRMVREVHDSIGFALTNIMMGLEAVLEFPGVDDPRARRLIADARDQARSGQAEARRALRGLKAVNLSRQGLSVVVGLVDAFRHATSIRMSIDFGNCPQSFGQEIDAFLYRFVQEGLTNAIHHGNASNISLRFGVVRHHLIASIADDGVGAESLTEGIGFVGMRERLARLGGMLTARSTGVGFELMAHIPWSGTNSPLQF